MAVVSGILALASVLVFCAFLSKKLDLNAALLPLPVLGGVVLWLCLSGFAGLLYVGGLLVYLLAAAALGWLIYKKELADAVRRLAVPGVVFFAGGSLLFLALFALTRPMFIQWDEFTFWGTACRLTKLQNVLHPAAEGLLLARAYNPGLPLLAYFFQFFGSGFSEWSVYFALDTLFLAALSAMSGAFSAKRWPTAAILLAGGFLLPFFFTVPVLGGISNVYVSAMGDLFLGATFGGSLCLYLHSQKRPAEFVLLGVTLGFLTMIKDMGLAYALIAAFAVCLDWLFAAGRPTLRRFGKTVGLGLALSIPVPVLYLGWSAYVQAAAGLDKTAVGSAQAQTQTDPVTMLLGGVKQMLGLEPATERFTQVKGLILASPVRVPICLLGGGLLALALIFVVLGIAFVALPYGERRRPVLMGGALTAGLLAFLVFHLFLYVYNFSEQEALILKDYDRYIGPYYLGFLMLALGLLARSAEKGRLPRISRLAVMGVAGGVALLVGLRGTPAAGFLDYPHEMYEMRQDINRRAEEVNEYLDWSDRVLLIRQGDTGAAWNYYGYALNATLSGGFGGFGYSHPDDFTYTWDTTHMNLVDPEVTGPYGPLMIYPYQTACSAKDLSDFLRAKQYEYVLVDTPDEYFAEKIAPAFGLDDLPSERIDRDLLLQVDYSQDTIQWSLVNGGDAE